MAHYTLPFGNDQLTFDLDWAADVTESSSSHAPAELVIPPIEKGQYERVVIVFTDATRRSPDQWFAEKLLNALPFEREQIRFLCAIGMHRPSTHQEKVEKLGQVIVDQFQVDDHDPVGVITVGEVDGIPVEVNPALVESGTMVICTGVVEPHQYAGYSGGAKTAVIGCGGANTIRLTHGPLMLDQAGVRLGEIEGNPFQQFIRQAGAIIGVDYVVNAIMPDQITHAACGDVSIHDDLVRQARQLYEQPVPNAPYDIVIGGVGSPKDANLYQASRGATYLGLSAKPVIREGGVIILPAALPEGAGDGMGEQNFLAALTRWGANERLLNHLREVGCQPGEQRAYMVAQLLMRYHCIFVGSRNPAIVRAAGFRYAPTMASALAMATALLGLSAPRTLVVPHALMTIPTEI